MFTVIEVMTVLWLSYHFDKFMWSIGVPQKYSLFRFLFGFLVNIGVMSFVYVVVERIEESLINHYIPLEVRLESSYIKQEPKVLLLKPEPPSVLEMIRPP